MADPDYFTLAEFRTLPDMQDSQAYPDDRVLAAAAYITAIIEREVGTAFIPRARTETFDGANTYGIILNSLYVRSITSATVDGVAATGTLEAPNGIVRRRVGNAATPWTTGLGNIVITYTYGYSATPPADIKEAAMRGTRAYLLETSEKSGVLDRRSSVTNDLGGTTTYVIAGGNNPTGYPQVDAVIVGWRDRVRIPRIA
jgi:hypothetical protein